MKNALLRNRRHLDRHARPLRQKPPLILAVIRNAYELPTPTRDQLLLKQARSTAFDTVQFLVHLISPVEADVHHRVRRKGVEGYGQEAGGLDDLSTVPACGHEPDHVAWCGGLCCEVLFYGVHAVDYCRARADADEGHGAGEVVGDGAVGGFAFGGFDCVGGGRGRHSGGLGREVEEGVVRRRLESERTRSGVRSGRGGSAGKLLGRYCGTAGSAC